MGKLEESVVACAKEGEYWLLAELVWFARVLMSFGEGIAEGPGRGGGGDNQMAGLVWTRNPMVCGWWEARWEWRRFKESSILPVRPTINLACVQIRGTHIVRYQLVSSIKKARPSF